MQEANYALYLGKEYLSGRGVDGKIVLRSSSMEDVDLGFEKCKPFYFRNGKEKIVCLKFVNGSDVEAYYRKRTKAEYDGSEYDVVEERGNKIRLVPSQGDSWKWEKMGVGYPLEISMSKWINKEEVKITVQIENLL
ncbi:MAG: hypothetical protein K2K70_14695 [Lachnospiraceae bacterium]|nr:hypothetical protein [Lachnospiraceae bacterium]